MTKYICVINWKGGCGKTTIATHLAVALVASGLETGLADYDRDQSQETRLDLLEHQGVTTTIRQR